jgi:hypothetical protein
MRRLVLRIAFCGVGHADQNGIAMPGAVAVGRYLCNTELVSNIMTAATMLSCISSQQMPAALKKR